MSSMHRIIWIDREIRNNHYPNCAAIAEQFSISNRQAARDVEYLKDSLCAPIEYSRRRQGYFYREDSFMVGHVMMTEQQKIGMAYLADRYAQMESEHATHLARLFRRLVDDSPVDHAEQTFPLFPIEPQELSIFDELQQAINSYAKIEVELRNDQDKTMNSIRMSPYKIYSFRGENYVVGFCEPMRQIRFFGFAAIGRTQPTDEKFDLTPLLRQAEIVPELYCEPETAIVRFDVSDYARSFRYPAEHIRDDVYRISFEDPNRLLAALFMCPSLCEIESPSWLRNKYRHELKRKYLERRSQ